MLSFVEGLPTPLAGGYLPRVVVVPFESGYPGFGAVHLLPGRDHVSVCKPTSRGDPSYAALLAFVRGAVADLGAGDGSCAGPMGTGTDEMMVHPSLITAIDDDDSDDE